MHETALSAYRSRLEVAAIDLSRRHRQRRRRRLTALVAAVVLMAAAATTLASVGLLGAWVGGTAAPPEVREDFAAIKPELGHTPSASAAEGVARDGEIVLYATPTKQGGLCMVADVPWLRFDGDGRGYCIKREDAEHLRVAGIIGEGPGGAGFDVTVVAGRTRDAGATTVRFSDPNGEPAERPVEAGGFFVAAVAGDVRTCFTGTAWSPTLTIADAEGRELAQTTFPLWIPGRDIRGNPMQTCSVMSPMSGETAARILRKEERRN